MKKKRFNPINFIPNQSKYQRGLLNESFEKELEGLAANEIQRELLLKKSKKHLSKNSIKKGVKMLFIICLIIWGGCTVFEGLTKK